MEYTSLNDLREIYLKFFESKGHLRLPSFSLVPKDDNSILLINAGMTPMKKYFTGEITPPSKRVTTCQKCIRTADIENVGKTARHGTYFEMLGNFSFGDYFKKEIIPWAWEFLTDVLKMPSDRLYCSVFTDDDEAYKIWTEKVGVKPDHMVRFGKEDNFWEHGAGPCGPCSEIYFDRGEKYGCGKPTCGVGCDCDRYVELWNLVFTQYENDGKGNYTKLAHPNIDTGMGLERLACVMQDVNNIFEVDTVRNIMKSISDIAGKKYGENDADDVSLRIITDHIRSAVFMVSDGVLPSNTGRGYVLRRLIRRAEREGRLLGIDNPFLSVAADTVIDENQPEYSDLLNKRAYIKKVIRLEEETFSKTLDTGLQILNDMIKNAANGILSGENAFKLSDTFGFPIDLTKEILREHNMKVDEKTFAERVKQARQLAKNAHKKQGSGDWRNMTSELSGINATEFIGYEKSECEAEIIAIVSDGKRVDFLSDSQSAEIILDKTVFYAKSGGQVGDTGKIIANGSEFDVEDADKTPDSVFIHHGTLSGETIKVGDKVRCEINIEERKAAERNHTSAHLLQAALRKVLGDHVHQAGQLVDSHVVRFDFTHFEPLTKEEIVNVEMIVNSEIMKAEPVKTEVLPIEEAKKTGAMALFGEKYGKSVRVVSVGSFSKEFCGGTHVSNTGEIGLFKIASEQSVSSGVRRIVAYTGFNLLKRFAFADNFMARTISMLKSGTAENVFEKIKAMSEEVKTLQKEIEKLRADEAKEKASKIIDSAEEYNGVRILAVKTDDGGADKVRQAMDTARQFGDDIVFVTSSANEEKGTVSFGCFCGKTALAKGAHAGKIIKEVATVASGSGGGKLDSAMAGGKDLTKVDEALKKAPEIVKKYIK